jgi:hypothetical protein
VTAAASNTNHVFLKLSRDGSNLVTGAVFEVNTTGTQPADSVYLCTLTTDTDNITATKDLRRMPALYGPIAIGSGSTAPHEGSVTISGNQALQGIHFYNDFTLNSGITATLNNDSHRLIIVAAGTITINGTIDGVGAAATGGTSVTQTAPGVKGSLGFSQAGGGGGETESSSVDGGAGGDVFHHSILVRAGGSGASGVGDTPASLTAETMALSSYFSIFGGAGGGSGGSGTSGAQPLGGAGGRGGGSIVLVAPTIILGGSAVLNTSGGAGANGGDATANDSGGGGGGGAGNVYIFCNSYTDNGATFTLSGGAGGTAGGFSGFAGGPGAAGTRQIFLM